MRYFLTSILGLVILFCGLCKAAEESAQYRANASYESTSDKVSTSTVGLGYRNHRRDMLWPYADEAAESWDFGVDLALRDGLHIQNEFTGTSAEAMVARKFSQNLMAQAAFGIHSLFRPSNPTLSTPILQGQFVWLMTPEWTLDLSARHDYSYVKHQPGPAASGLTNIDSSLSVRGRPLERLKMALSVAYESFSDGNLRRKIEGSVMYGIAIAEPWIWVGLGGEYYGYNTNTATQPLNVRYYSPTAFRGIGPRAELALPLGKNFQGAFGGSLSWIKEENFNSGISYFLSPSLRYGDRNGWLASIGYTHIRSEQSGSTWTSHAVEANISGAL